MVSDGFGGARKTMWGDGSRKSLARCIKPGASEEGRGEFPHTGSRTHEPAAGALRVLVSFHGNHRQNEKLNLMTSKVVFIFEVL